MIDQLAAMDLRELGDSLQEPAEPFRFNFETAMHGRWPTRVRELYVHRLFVDDDLKLHACLALELSYGVQVKVQAYRLQLLVVWDCENVGYIRIIMCICEQILYFKYQGKKKEKTNKNGLKNFSAKMA